MQRPPRVLVAVDSTRLGGAERQAVELAKGLTTRHFVSLVSLDGFCGGYDELIRAASIRFARLPRRHRYDPFPLVPMVRLIRRDKIDIVHALMNMASLFGLIAARICRVPVVCSPIRGAFPSAGRAGEVERFIARHADLVVSNSKAGFNTRFPTWQPNFRVVYNGVDLSRFNHVGESVREIQCALGLQGFKRTVGMIASLIDSKDHMLMLDVAKIVVGRRPDTCFLVVGDGHRRQALEARAQALGLQNHVLFTGHRTDTDRVHALLDVALLLTNPVCAMEGISNALIESMANGVPVVATNTGGTPEFVENGRNGFLVEPGDVKGTAAALLALLDDSELRARLGRAAQETVQSRFSLEQHIASCEALYAELLPSGHSKTRS